MMDPATTLQWMQSRRTTRRFLDRPVDRPMVERLLRAASSAPSSTNRQPWRFSVVAGHSLRGRIAAAVQARVAELEALVGGSHHAGDFAGYGDFFHEPLQGAPLIIVPQFREHPDILSGFIESSGADPAAYTTAAVMEHERCSAAAAVMLLLLQAHAEGLGACWMAGPMLAEREICDLLGIHDPWRMLGAIALGHPAERPAPRPRKDLEKIATWFEDESGGTP